MELALQRKRSNPRIIVIMAVMAVLCLIPPAIVLASALNDPTIGMTGVNNSQLTLGMHATDDSTRLLDNSGHPTILNPSSPAGQLAIIIPLIFIFLGILLIWYLIETKQSGIKILVVIAVLIYVLLALLPSINDIVRNLLGY